jgi:hypothetical protein
MSELPDFVSDGSPSAPAVQPEPQVAPEVHAADAAPAAEAPEAAPAAEGPLRGPDGKFLPKGEAAPAAAQPDTPAAVEPQSAQPVTPESPFAPLAALLDEREKRQKAEAAAAAAQREAAEARKWREEQEARANRQPLQQAPDPETDPEGYQQWALDQHISARLDAALYQQTLGISRRFAVTQHGAELVDTAFEWGVKRCDEDPYFNAKIRKSQDPVGDVVAEYQREQQLGQISSDEWTAFQAWKKAQAAAPAGQAAPQNLQAAPAAPAPPPKPAAPRPSLASAPSAASSAAALPRDGEGAFEAMFNR